MNNITNNTPDNGFNPNHTNAKSVYEDVKIVSSGTIAVCFILSFLVVPFFVGLILLAVQANQIKKMKISHALLNQFRVNSENYIKERIAAEEARLVTLINKVNDPNFIQLQGRIDEAERKIESSKKKIEKLSYLYNAVKNCIEQFNMSSGSNEDFKTITKMIEEIQIDNLMEPTVEVRLHCDDIKELRRKFREINKIIDDTFAEYEQRYIKKSNIALYRLMIIALRSELQNVLYTMKFGRLEDAEESIKKICDKYIVIAAEGNQTIAVTLAKFIGETQSLFLDAVKVEYEYYLRKEKAKEEQRALREQMRQEAEERKILEAQKKKVEKEESKYVSEMDNLREQAKTADAEKSETIAARIQELENLLKEVESKKEEIANLQNGKAGYVYIISNLGSFGDHVFKVGMTRRLEPQERVDELGSASVPFSFDVHSFIFSEDAPTLENEMHRRLNDRRVNKINTRKEFFDISLDELEELVYEIEPSAEFNRTMAAEEYRLSMSVSEAFEQSDDIEVDDE